MEFALVLQGLQAAALGTDTGNRQKTNRRKAVKPEITRWIVRYLATVRLTLSSAVLHNFAGDPNQQAILDEAISQHVIRAGLKTLYFTGPFSAARCLRRSLHVSGRAETVCGRPAGDDRGECRYPLQSRQTDRRDRGRGDLAQPRAD